MSDADFDTVKQLQRERNEATSAKKRRKVDSGSQRATAPEKQSLTQSHDTIYERDGADKFAGYNTSISVNDDEDVDMEDGDEGRLVGQYTASASQMKELTNGGPEDVDMINSREQGAQIQSRESDYQKRRFDRDLSPTRADPFAQNGEAQEGRSYKEVMAERELEKEEERVRKLIADREKNGEDVQMEHEATLKDENAPKEINDDASTTTVRKRKKRWDVGSKEDDTTSVTTRRSRWDKAAAPESIADSTTTTATRKSRWDQAPAISANSSGEDGAAAAGSAGPGNQRPGHRSFTDEELDQMLPSEGYKILEPPPKYSLAQAVARRAPPPSSTGGFMMQEPARASAIKDQMPSTISGVGELSYWKPEDQKYFGKLAETVDENTLDNKQVAERKILRLLLKVKNGSPPMRKTAIRQLTDNAKAFGAEALFGAILPILMEKTLEDQERHLLVKVIDRVLYKLDYLVRPHVHKILVVIEPLLIDQDYYARMEGREIISNLAKAAGLAHMISTMRPDVDRSDEYVRNTTARAFAVVAYSLGIPALLPFLRAVCKTKKSWEARHTGVKIVQQIPILMGCGVLPHLKSLVECIGENLKDEQVKVRTITALAVAALAEAANPYGIESFDEILNPLWTGARKQRGKPLAGFLKAVGYLIPLMDKEYSAYYTDQIMTILRREFNTGDEEMKKVVLKVLSQCSQTEGVTAKYLEESVLPEFYKAFWIRRMALDKRNYRQVVDTTIDLGRRVGSKDIVQSLVVNLKDESEPFRKMTMEVLEKVIASEGLASVDTYLEERLVDGILTAFQQQGVEDSTCLTCFGAIVTALGERCKPYLQQIASTILYRLGLKVPMTRQLTADFIPYIVPVMKMCDEEELIVKLSEVLYEFLGEEYPEVLGSILGAMRAIVPVMGIESMKPPIKDLVTRLAPILRNRHEKVQENTIDLVGRIADRGPEAVPPREWMRICFELLDMLKAHKKAIRRAANNTFGYIAKAIGPQDVLSTLLNNLRVQERQSRVCTAVAIGIVAETCAPFTVLPALMNEYRVPELNVQNGVLKSLSFLFEYIGEMAKDYVYAITPLLEDALIDRDQVHRQTAASVVKHVALGVAGLGCEDAMVHLLNLIFPNIFETSPHVIDRIIEAIEGIRVAVGPGPVLNYIWSGMYHPARKVRNPYWRVYNDCYVQSADAMIPYYPNLEEIGGKREELEVFI